MTEREKLLNKIDMFDSFFCDMAFLPGATTFEFIADKANTQEDNKKQFHCYEWFNFKVEPLNNLSGCFEPQTHTIILPPESLEDNATILHEMINAYESVLDELPIEHDIVFLVLYQALKNQIPKLDEIIKKCAPLLIDTNGDFCGYHDILFLLKSFDLDIRMKYPLGTVLSYGFDYILKDYSYKAL